MNRDDLRWPFSAMPVWAVLVFHLLIGFWVYAAMGVCYGVQTALDDWWWEFSEIRKMK